MGYYVKIDQPKAFRRDILESSKKVINSLQANKQVLEIREKKRGLLEHLGGLLKELSLLSHKLDEFLPEKQLREEAMQAKKVEETVVKRSGEEESLRRPVPPKVETTPSNSREEAELQRALSSIEQKLSRLE